MSAVGTRLVLYRRLLRAAQQYPSKKRASVLQEVKDAFRENRDEADEAKLHLMVQEAEGALEHMERFSTMKKTKDWQYSFG